MPKPERRVNQGGEPGHDDYGLPRVDIEIPDDARELDRDVQAYHRELRALRRHQRSRRWRAPLRRSGVLMPLVIGCLLAAMLSGMVLTMFSTNSYITRISRLSGQQQGAVAGGSSSFAPDQRADVVLPDRTITVAGKPVALRTLTSVALALIPATCRCSPALRELLALAKAAGIPVYLIGSPGSGSAIAKLTAAAGHGTALVAADNGHVLAAAYHPVGLTVLLVDYQGTVTVAPGLPPRPQFAQRLAGLIRPGQ